MAFLDLDGCVLGLEGYGLGLAAPTKILVTPLQKVVYFTVVLRQTYENDINL